jgi:hypothetical protein
MIYHLLFLFLTLNISFKLTKRLKFGDKMICVFWDFYTLIWSTKGCHLVSLDFSAEFIVCECDHLGNFAAIQDINERKNKSWINGLIDKNISDINAVIECLNYIKENTDGIKSLETCEELKYIVQFLSGLQEFINSDNQELNFNMALNVTIGFLDVLSNIIKQSNGFINATSDEKTEIASKILLRIQYCSHIFGPNMSDTNRIIEIEKKNIFMKIFPMNFSQKLSFSNNGSFIETNDVYFDGNNESYFYATGFVINELGNYLSPKTSVNQEINSYIIALFTTKSNETNQNDDSFRVLFR